MEHLKITHRVQIMAVIFCWIQGLIWAGAPLLGWSGYAMEGKQKVHNLILRK